MRGRVEVPAGFGGGVGEALEGGSACGIGGETLISCINEGPGSKESCSGVALPSGDGSDVGLASLATGGGGGCVHVGQGGLQHAVLVGAVGFPE